MAPVFSECFSSRSEREFLQTLSQRQSWRFSEIAEMSKGRTLDPGVQPHARVRMPGALQRHKPPRCHGRELAPDQRGPKPGRRRLFGGEEPRRLDQKPQRTALGLCVSHAAARGAACSSNGQFRFSLADGPGHPYAILASTDLTNWTAVQTNCSPFTLTDTDAPGGPCRFYRAQYRP